VSIPRDSKGRFIKGHRYSPKTELKKGQHWRQPKPYWNSDFLYNEYVVKQRSAAEIAVDFDCIEKNILYFLKKFNIKTRSISETRKAKYWGAKGKDNPMYGVTGDQHPNWKGGITPERQAFYQSAEWKRACRIVWSRDTATCQKCKIKHLYGMRSYHVHHIVSFEVGELRAEPNNLVLLCRNCHNWVHSKENTEKEFLWSIEEDTQAMRSK